VIEIESSKKVAGTVEEEIVALKLGSISQSSTDKQIILIS